MRKARMILLIVLGLLIIGASLVLKNSGEGDGPQETVNFREMDDRTINIAKYENFYRSPNFYSQQATEFFGLTATIEKYALLHYLEQQGYELEEKRRTFNRKILKDTLEYDMRDEKLKVYFEKMFAELDITADEYMDYYLMVNKEYDLLQQEMFNKGNGLDEYGGYPGGDAAKAYQELMGISEDYLNDLAEQMPGRLEPLDPQPDLLFDTTDVDLKVTTNEQGDFIFIDRAYFNIYSARAYSFLLLEIEERIVKEELTRHSLARYQEAVRNYESDDSQKMQLAQELTDVLEVLEQSIEKDYVVDLSWR